MLIIAFLLGLALGAALLFWYNRSHQHRRYKMPAQWPLHKRPLANNREKRVWVWLAKVMFDQQIMVKLPITRFTAPTSGANARHWYQLLNGVYCSFTVCNLEGEVLGCIDVPGPRGLSMSNQTLKHALLTQCGIHYLVLDPDALPHLVEIRTMFLGEHAAHSNAQPLGSHFRDVSENLHATVDRQRQGKSNAAAQLDASLPNTPEGGENHINPGWEHNSFVTPLDSRSADLRR